MSLLVRHPWSQSAIVTITANLTMTIRVGQFVLTRLLGPHTVNPTNTVEHNLDTNLCDIHVAPANGIGPAIEVKFDVGSEGGIGPTSTTRVTTRLHSPVSTICTRAALRERSFHSWTSKTSADGPAFVEDAS